MSVSSLLGSAQSLVVDHVPRYNRTMARWIRRNQSSLSAAERTTFVDILVKLKRQGTYDRYVREHQQVARHIHRGPAFLSWHREFLRRFELDMRNANSNLNLDIALPYWDWTVDRSPTSSLWAEDFMGGDGDPEVTTGPFAYATGNWTCVSDRPELRRQFGRGTDAPTLPTADDVAACLELTPFDAAPWSDKSTEGFRNRLEGWREDTPGLHNRVHMWIGGSMAPMSSPNDPVFFLHHCNIDRLWAAWQYRHPEQALYLPADGAMQGHNLGDKMPPWNDRDVSSTIDHSKLGYAYDTDPRRATTAELRPGETLHPFDSVSSPSGNHLLRYLPTGRLVLYENISHTRTLGSGSGALTLPGAPTLEEKWASTTDKRSGGRCVLQADGKLVVYQRDGTVLWSSDTAGPEGRLVVDDSGAVRLYAPGGRQVWLVRR